MCFCVSRFVALFLKSTVSFTLVLSLFNFFILKRGKFRFQRWNCYYRACKSGGNTDKKGFKRTGTFPLTFTFADKHSRCYGNGLIDVAEKFEFGACSIWIVEDVSRGSFLFPTYLGRSKETLFAGYEFTRECVKINKMRPKFHFLTRIQILMTHLVVLFCYWQLSLCFKNHLEAVLSTFKILSCTNNQMGRLVSLKPTVPTRSFINPIKIVLTLRNCRERICR